MDNSSARKHDGKDLKWFLVLLMLGACLCVPLARGQVYTFNTLAGLAGTPGSADGRKCIAANEFVGEAFTCGPPRMPKVGYSFAVME